MPPSTTRSKKQLRAVGVARAKLQRRQAAEARATARSRMDVPGRAPNDRVKRVIKSKGKPRP